MKIVADEHIPFVHEYFGGDGELILKPGRMISAADVKEADMLLVRSVTPVNAQLLENSRVKFVGSVTAGADHLDTAWLDKVDIAWSVATGFNAPPVADYVVSIIAALQRKQILAFTGMKAAVIGVGNVGQLVAERLRLLNFQVILCDPLRAAADKDFQTVSLDEIADVDFISLHVPLTYDGDHPTHHMINEKFLQRQKVKSVLLNASRGAVVDSQALLTHGAHMLWCLDVWENEPNINKDILNHAFISTPHIAGYSVQSKIRGTEMIYRIACDKKIITKQASPIEMPHQTLSFSGAEHHWQDIVMGVFNPLVMSAMMRTAILPAHAVGQVFDNMRHQFNYRHEFSYTQLVEVDAPAADKAVLERLGIENYRLH